MALAAAEPVHPMTGGDLWIVKRGIGSLSEGAKDRTVAAVGNPRCLLQHLGHLETPA